MLSNFPISELVTRMQLDFDYVQHSFTGTLASILLLCLIHPINKAHAGNWQDSNAYAGAWSTTQIHHNFKHASKIDFILWENSPGDLAGLTAFHRGKERCIGHVSPADNGSDLIFRSIEGNICEGLDDGYFEVLRQAGNGRMMLAWFPAKVKEEDKNKLRIYSGHNYRQLKQPPDYWTSYLRKFKDSRQTVGETVAAHATNHAKEIERTKSSLNKEFLTNFSEAELMGVWQGYFIDKLNVYPAEIAFWSSKIYRLQHIVGFISFEGPQCTTGFAIHDSKPEIVLRNLPSFVNTSGENCIGIQGQGVINLSKTGGELSIFFTSQTNMLDGFRTENCLDDLPREGCYTVGHFKRANASAGLLEFMKHANWEIIAPPPEIAWNFLQTNKPVPENIKMAHTDLASKNDAIKAGIRLEREKARQKEREEFERKQTLRRQRQEELAEKRFWSDPQAQQAAITKIEVVKGPFDGIDGSNFLNALYHGDFASLKRQTRAYQALKIKQRSDFLGNQPHWSDDMQNAAFKSMRLIDTVYGIYLFNYQSYYSRCLTKDAVTFTVTKTTPDVVITNFLGWEVARYYGSTDITEYKINPEFVTIFRQIGRTNPDSPMMALADLLMGGGGIDLPPELVGKTGTSSTMSQFAELLKGDGKRDLRNQLLKGVRQMMQNFDCDSPAIKQLEMNMLKANR